MTILLFNHLNECWKKHKNPFKSARASMLKHSPKSNTSFSRSRRAHINKLKKQLYNNTFISKVMKGGLIK